MARAVSQNVAVGLHNRRETEHKNFSREYAWTFSETGTAVLLVSGKLSGHYQRRNAE